MQFLRSTYRPPVLNTADLRRVVALRRRQWAPEDAQELAVEMTKVLRTPHGQMQLWPLQAVALYELCQEGGAFLPLAVGFGKTLCSLLAPTVLQRVKKTAYRPLLVVPAGLIEKTERDRRALAEHWQLAPFIKIMSYEILGRVQAEKALEDFAPDFVFLDECHRAKRRRSAACARRIHRHLTAHPNVIVAAASGTVTTHSLHDYAHILHWCLPPSKTPIPVHWSDLESWALALDERVSEPNHPGELIRLCNDEEKQTWKENPWAAARAAFRRRLVDTVGIVATKESSIGTSLVIRGVKAPPSNAIEEAFKILRTYETPGGEPIADGLQMARHAREIASGFWYRWDPAPPRSWLEPRRVWCKFVRDVLKHSKSLDSELQVRNWAAQLHECKELSDWLAVRDTFEPNTVPVWICDSVIDFTADWAKTHRGVVWNEHRCFGERLEVEHEIPYYGRKGRDCRGAFIDDHPAGQSLVASVDSNKEGRNLQKWAENLVLCMPSSGSISEQMLGRTHRHGQLADEVTVDVFVGCVEHFGAFEQACRHARYIESTTGSAQKLNLATIDMPQTLVGFGSRWEK